MNKFDEVKRRVFSSFNDVAAWITPNGELVISLSHRNTSDEDVLIRVRGEDDVILVDKAIEAYFKENGDSDPWEDPSCQIGRLNKGGNWDLTTTD